MKTARSLTTVLLTELLVGAAILAGMALLARLASDIVLGMVTQAVVLCFLALGIGFLLRTLGLVSFGHAAPFGFGAYGVALAFSKTLPLSPELALVLIVPGVMLVYFLVGLVIGRLEGISFSMLTLALGQFVYVAASKLRGVTGGSDGMIVNLPRRLFGLVSDPLQQPATMAFLATALLLATLFLLRRFEGAHAGRLAIAVRENEERARFLGYRTRALKAAVFAASSGIAALGGMIFALYQGFVSPEALTWGFSGSGLIMAILGGTVYLWGPVLGALAFFGAREGLSQFTHHWHALLGVLLIVVTVFWPRGLSGAIRYLAEGRMRTAKASRVLTRVGKGVK